ncbi:DinB family protein [Cellulomonas rhizosphaerae]|uniref:DinB family protein n=1 Tax=Cellulomonas rhizosphaerae TaxID=2293719 RepID=A0A413RKL9_9CELL|nr:DinB family protein [Cellulomonas rhizosphaerae]RHA39655.1 DinB family protein [Cellulomonas rhizosphaerae]
MVERAVLPLVLSGYDDAWHRLDARLAGLSDDEYLWEPVGGAWTVRAADEGWLVDWEDPEPDPAPVTTIAWRLWHLGSDCLADYLRASDVPRPVAVTGRAWHGTAAPALADLRAAAAAFRATMAALGENGIWAPMGPDWGPFGEEPWAALVVHATDELAHHGAEIALLRDLYRWRA